jgi:type IV pilus biogenesis protein CpaD/CtpE
LALALVALLLSGCSQVITTALPDLTPSDRPVLSSAEQERAIKAMIEKKNNQSSAIEETKAKAP